MNTPTFQPHPLLKGGNAQTIAAVWWPATRFFPKHTKKTFRTVVDAENTLITHSHLQPQNSSECDDILLVHGFEGSSVSKYMLRMAKKSLQRKYNVHRMNLRSCGDSMRLCALPYHAGLWSDVLKVAQDVQVGKRLFIIGYSLGGNITLKMAGEKKLPESVAAIASVCAPLDLQKTLDRLIERPLYHKKFLGYICKNYERKRRIHPHTFPRLDAAPRSLVDFDEKVICRIYGFKGSQDYYTQSSCKDVLSEIEVPTLAIYAKDDPIIPCENYDDLLQQSENIEILAPSHGGHVAFIGDGKVAEDSDRFWADERIFSFFSRF
ncbi:YheT family hydrolase [Candidatus Uabimicrobium amorphum]|uniref:Alpha/beta hydrolase n=1 Tax=Uabimicrobium amorphum TaxID=2596890 RepID=A0A5S9IT66_UABAM|nr:alpha/beta fold hydrolase [Candidatus Uabimicrobium amorphum]BBM86690.1 alpha/beta hydrolase [Candidatus Uabimicrobium amorphum]